MSRARPVLTVLATAATVLAAAAGTAAATGGPPRSTPAPTRSTPPAASPPAGTEILATGVSGIQPTVVVLGSDGTRVLWDIQGIQPDDGGQPVEVVEGLFRVPYAGGAVATYTGLDLGNAGGTTAGSTYVYDGTMGDPMYADITTGAHGVLGPVIGVAFPGGVVSAGRQTLDVDRIDGSRDRLGTVPDITDPDHTQLIADTHGVLARQGTTIDWFSLASRTATKLDTAGITSAAFRCTSVSAGAVGCTDGATVYRIPTDGSAPVAIAAAAVVSVVVTPTATAWISGPGHRLSSRSTRAGAATTSTAYPVESAFAVGDGLAFSRDGATVGGVYRTASAGGPATLLARAPVRAIEGRTVAVGAGRVTWVDDSTTSFPVRARRLTGSGATGVPGPVTTVNPGSWVRWPAQYGEGSPADLSTSGTRTLLAARPVGGLTARTGSVLLRSGPRTTVLSTNASGELVLSGSRALWGTPDGSVFLRNLATGSTRDLTAAFGVRATGQSLLGTLYGRYLAYAAGGGAWRLDLATGRAERLGTASGGRSGLGAVLTAGDFVAWTTVTGVSYRDARTMGPVRVLAGQQEIVSVSQAGLVVSGGSGARFHAWTGGPAVAVPAGVLALDSGFVAFLDSHLRPAVAPLAGSAARPQALGSPLAATRIRRGSAWSLDQPTSQPVTACTVVVRDPAGTVVARLRCNAAGAAQGEVLAAWSGLVAGHRPAPGRYRWQIVARNRSGGILPGNGVASAVTGSLLVTA